MFLCNNKDLEMLQWVREFNKFDLYTKCPDTPDIEQLKRYYGNLVEQCFEDFKLDLNFENVCNNCRNCNTNTYSVLEMP